MKYKFSKHAIVQIERRDIPKKVVDEVLYNPESIYKHDNCVNVFQKVIDEDKNNYLYRVFVNTCKDPALIITVYKTSKIRKYENKI